MLNFESIADFARLMSEANLQLLWAVGQDGPGSIRRAAELVDRDYKKVHRNQSNLEALGVIESVEEDRSNRPIVPFDEINVELQMVDDGDRSVPAQSELERRSNGIRLQRLSATNTQTASETIGAGVPFQS